MIVVFELPQRSSGSASILEFGSLLELVGEIEQAALRRKTFAEKMHVVRHEAIGVNCKGESIGHLRQNCYEASHNFRIRQERPAMLTTNCEEVRSLTNIVVSGEPDILANNWHLCRSKMPPLKGWRYMNHRSSQDATLKGWRYIVNRGKYGFNGAGAGLRL